MRTNDSRPSGSFRSPAKASRTLDAATATEPRRKPTSGGRLGVYVDAVYASTAHGVSVDPIDAAFLLFVAEVGGRFDSLLVFGRTVVSTGTEGSRFVPLPASIELVPLPYYRSLTDLRAVAGSLGGTLRAFWRALGRVDVVWALGPHPLSLVLVPLARIRRKRLVLGVRQDTVEYFRSRVSKRRLRPLLMGFARLLDLTYRALALRYPVTVVGSQIARRYRGPRPGVHEMVVSLVRATDVVAEAGNRRDRTKGETLLLTVGRVEPEKTPFVLVDALAELDRLRPGRYRLRWIGHGRMEADVRERTAIFGIESLVELPGYVPFGPELLAAYREADVFVHVAATEGVPQVLLEALAAGTPVVATDVGGVRTVIGDEEAGLLVPPSDPNALVAAITRLDDVELRSRLVQAGLDRVRDLTLEAQAEGVARFLSLPPA